MTREEIIAIIIIAVIIFLAILYIVKAKKSGKKCIGCPYASSCNSKKSANNGGCSCGCSKKENNSK